MRIRTGYNETFFVSKTFRFISSIKCRLFIISRNFGLRNLRDIEGYELLIKRIGIHGTGIHPTNTTENV